jgi:hypothetical protein
MTGCVGIWVLVHACSLAYPACKAVLHIVTFVALLAPPYFSTLSHQRRDFRKNVVEHKMFVLIFSTTFVLNISYRKHNLARYCHKCENVFMWSNCYCCWILMELEFSWQIFKKSLNIKFYDIPRVGVELFHADGQTDMAKLIVAFRNLAKAPKIPSITAKNVRYMTNFFTTYFGLVGVSTLSWWGGLSMPETLRAIPAVA